METNKLCAWCDNFFSEIDDDFNEIEGVAFHTMCLEEIEGQKLVRVNKECIPF